MENNRDFDPSGILMEVQPATPNLYELPERDAKDPNQPQSPRYEDLINDESNVEECLICWEEAPVTSFITLPCAFGHRYMKTCIIRWLQDASARYNISQCPSCREEFRFSECGHPLDGDLLGRFDRELIKHDLIFECCWSCRAEDRASRRAYYRLQANSPQEVSWEYLRPGDLESDVLLDRCTPPHLRDKFTEVRDEHANKVQRWREQVEDMRTKWPSMEEIPLDEIYWELRSKIADYELAWDANVVCADADDYSSISGMCSDEEIVEEEEHDISTDMSEEP
jgi:hypothetical protein